MSCGCEISTAAAVSKEDVSLTLPKVETYTVEHLARYFPQTETVSNPLAQRSWPEAKNFVAHDEKSLSSVVLNAYKDKGIKEPIVCKKAGPAESIYFRPEEVRAAIVTCGGLCPGLNTVIRELVMALTFSYGVKQIYGVPNGYRGFYEESLRPLDKETVSTIHRWGGTILGTTRGGFDKQRICDAIAEKKLNQIYIIGGDGTHRGAQLIGEELIRRGIRAAVVAIPKTIDNDIPITDKSFGFDTAVSEAVHPINCAHTEARAAPNGIGLVKLMGRQSGFIAMNASLASRDVNLCIIPEAPWTLQNVCKFLEERFKKSDHAVIVVAEGASCPEMHIDANASKQTDESGNPILPDVGSFLKKNIDKHFKEKGDKVTIKYIEPTYMIRSTPANPIDSLYCADLAFQAVHGAFAGYTNFTVGMVDTHYVWLPITAVACLPPRNVDIHGPDYARLCYATGQPRMDDHYMP